MLETAVSRNGEIKQVTSLNAGVRMGCLSSSCNCSLVPISGIWKINQSGEIYLGEDHTFSMY